MISRSVYYRFMESSDDCEDSQEFVEILRCVRGDEARSYRLRAVAGGAELWRVTHSDPGGLHSIKEGDFQSSEQARRGGDAPRFSAVRTG